MIAGLIRVAIIDDHPIVRAGIRAVLTAAPDFDVVAEGASGQDAIRLLDERRPDMLVLDVNLPDINGLEVARRLRSQGNRTPIVILTVHNDSQTVLGLLETGASGYVIKDEAPDRLASAVRAASRGETWLSPVVAGQVVRRALSKSSDRAQPAENTDLPLSPLTAREGRDQPEQRAAARGAARPIGRHPGQS
jgi:DNA-binding NarL/FixJ family response regulator